MSLEQQKPKNEDAIHTHSLANLAWGSSGMPSSSSWSLSSPSSPSSSSLSTFIELSFSLTSWCESACVNTLASSSALCSAWLALMAGLATAGVGAALLGGEGMAALETELNGRNELWVQQPKEQSHESYSPCHSISYLLAFPIIVLKLENKSGLSSSHLQPTLSTEILELLDIQSITRKVSVSWILKENQWNHLLSLLPRLLAYFPMLNMHRPLQGCERNWNQVCNAESVDTSHAYLSV